MSEAKEEGVKEQPALKWRREMVEAQLEGWATRDVEVLFDASGTHLRSLLELRLSYPKRCSDLTKAIRVTLASRQWIPAAILARALLETIGMGCHFLSDMDRLITAGNITKLDARLDNYVRGSTRKGGSIKGVHVQDAMRHLENIDLAYLRYLDGKLGLFSAQVKLSGDSSSNLEEAYVSISVRETYKFLCDLAHPTGTGTFLAYPDEDSLNHERDEIIRRCQRFGSMAIWHCQHLIKALESSEDFHDRFRAAFKPNS